MSEDERSHLTYTPDQVADATGEGNGTAPLDDVGIEADGVKPRRRRARRFGRRRDRRARAAAQGAAPDELDGLWSEWAPSSGAGRERADPAPPSSLSAASGSGLADPLPQIAAPIAGAAAPVSPVTGGDGATFEPSWTFGDATLDTSETADGAGTAAQFPPAPPPIGPDDGESPDTPAKPRLKKLRLFAIVCAVLLLGLVSFVFGMFMAVASDIPALEKYPKFNSARNSVLLDDQGRTLGLLSDHNRILVGQGDIPRAVKDAAIAIEDKRFYHNSGIDPRGIARAFFQDILHKRAVQGASTVEQQFVKNALQAQSHRTIFEKLREAALAYHLTRKWSKDRIITEYLNTIYFGNGAYGVEAAARTYFGRDVNHLGCGTLQRLCVRELKPWEAALLGGMIASPSAYDPVAHPVAATQRRNLVLRDMWQQGYLSHQEYEDSISQPLPASKDIQPPREFAVTPALGYFASWVRQQLIERYGAQRALEGGLRVRTTIDLDLQKAAEQAINGYLADPSGPTASLVAIDNATGEVRAMVGGRDYNTSPFNLATAGERQPGSSFKAFVLAQALREGVSPDSVWTSAVKTFTVPGSAGQEHFVVHNDNNAYSGTISLNDATAYSDNSVFAEMGIKAGTSKIAHLAERMGIRTPVSTNPAMTIGGLKTGVTPLDMAHAYETLAHGGERVDSNLVADGGPSGIEDVQSPTPLPNGRHDEHDIPQLVRVLPASLVSTETQMLQGVIQYGTGRSAAIGQFAAGKTGTTENYGDAWFVGWNSHYTVAVWVGYPDRLKPMTTDYNGGPVLGGTFPALIWHDFMTSAIGVDATRAAARAAKAAGATGSTTSTVSTTPVVTTATPAPSRTGTTPSTSNSPSHHGTGSGPAAQSPTPASSGGGGSSGSGRGGGGGGGSGTTGSGGGGGGGGSGTSGSGGGGSSGGGGGTSGAGSGGSAAPSGGAGAPAG